MKSLEDLVRRWMSLVGRCGIVLSIVACGGKSGDGGEPHAGGEGGEGAETAGQSPGGSTANGGTSTARGGTSSKGGSAQGGGAQGGSAQGGSAQGGSSQAGADGGDGGGPGGGGSPSGECAEVAPEGTKLCGSPVEVTLTSGLIGLEASFRYGLTSADCAVHSGFDVSAETEDVFIFRKEEDYGNNVSILYPWNYTLDGYDDSNNLPAGELITAHIEHECGVAFAIDFTFGDDSVNVSDVRREE